MINLITQEKFLSLIKELKQEYQGKNSKRLSYIHFLFLLHEQIQTVELDEYKKQQILTGAVTLGLEWIKSEYNYLSPTRSRLFNLITNKTKYNNETFSLPERLVSLNYCYEFCKEHITKNHIEQLQIGNNIIPIWQNNNDLLSSINEMLISIRNQDKKLVNELIRGTPELAGLQKSIDNIKQVYHEKKDQELNKSKNSFFSDLWTGTNPHRLDSLSFIEFINLTCKDIYPEEVLENKNQNKLFLFQEKECQIKKGLLLFVALQIQEEYKWLSPKGSNLFCALLEALNVENLNDISFKDKTDWLNALNNHLHFINDPNNKLYKDEKIQEWKNKKNSRPDTFLQNVNSSINHYIETYKKEIPKSTYLGWAASKGTSYLVNGALVTMSAYTINQGFIQNIGKKALTQITGTAIYSYGALAMTIGLSHAILPTVTLSIITWLLGRAANSIGKQVGKYIDQKYYFSATKEGIHELVSKLTKEDKIIFDEWVSTLLRLPENIVSEKEKHQISMVLGVNNNITKPSSTLNLVCQN